MNMFIGLLENSRNSRQQEIKDDDTVQAVNSQSSNNNNLFDVSKAFNQIKLNVICNVTEQRSNAENRIPCNTSKNYIINV